MNKTNAIIFILFNLLIGITYATCPSTFEEMGLPAINGQTKIKVDWIGEKSKIKDGVVGVIGGLCFSPDGKTCSGVGGEGESVELNTGSETEIFQAPGDANQKYSVCMNNCSRSKDLPFNSNESQDWHVVKSCLDEFKISLALVPNAPAQLSAQGKKDFVIFLNAAQHKAFAVSALGAYGYQTTASSIDVAKKDALTFCEKYSTDPCEIYMEDDIVVHP